jgi:N-methylhydantoinase B
MFQEGIILPGVKVVKKGVLDKELVDIIRHNSRVPDVIVGDMTAQIVACEAGEKRLLALIDNYGKDTLNEAIEAILDHDEKITRQAIAEIPDGEYHAEGWADDNGFDDKPLKLCLTVKVKGDEITFDTTGSAPQQPSAMNCPYPSTVAFCRLVTKMILEPHTRSSEGHWRPVTVIAPEGSILNPQPPAATYLYGWVGTPLGECIFKALAEVLPEKVVARSGGDICASVGHMGIDSKTGKWFLCAIGQTPVGQGASFDRDGGAGLIAYFMSGSEAIPVEIFEERGPVLIERWALRQDSGGPGKFRGGLGIERQIQALADCRVGGLVEETKFPAWGLFGGKSALPNVGILWPGTSKERKYGKISQLPFKKGERHLILTGGGGGWGDPYERDANAVLNDVIRGYISLESARKDYGVVIREEDGEYILDEVETEKLRKQKNPCN